MPPPQPPPRPPSPFSYAFNRTADFQTVQEIKEKFCYCAYVPFSRALGYHVVGRHNFLPSLRPLVPYPHPLNPYRADVAQERKLALETTVLMEKYTVRSGGELYRGEGGAVTVLFT